MSDFEFEARLERLFAQPPRLEDGAAFTRRVESKLERGWTVRRLLIGVAGLAGGFVAVSQAMTSEMFERVNGISLPAVSFSSPSTGESVLSQETARVLASGEVTWMAAALIGLAFAFAASRWVENI